MPPGQWNGGGGGGGRSGGGTGDGNGNCVGRNIDVRRGGGGGGGRGDENGVGSGTGIDRRYIWTRVMSRVKTKNDFISTSFGIYSFFTSF